MSNEINFLQILYEHLKYLFFSLMNVRIIKFKQCRACFINGPKFPEISLLETLYIAIKHLALIKFEDFIYIGN
jgi:hypothetical protein